jgi:hypothetical protein
MEYLPLNETDWNEHRPTQDLAAAAHAGPAQGSVRRRREKAIIKICEMRPRFKNVAVKTENRQKWRLKLAQVQFAQQTP